MWLITACPPKGMLRECRISARGKEDERLSLAAMLL
jgi:hypothetical protein